jgi:hypothetical protein
MSNVSAAESFNENILEFIAGVEEEAVQETMEVATGLFGELVIKTPVDQGIARSNWHLSRNRPIKRFSKKVLGEQAVIDRGLAKLDKLKLGNKIYFTNNTSYIRKLEEGGSRQRPNGWVKVAVERFKKRLL